jgi:NDP-sugar pyrophosphorylase family protein
MTTKAVILAGGRGTRLAPFTVNFPKPLVPIGDIPVLELLLRQLAKAGITDVTLTLGHLAELVRAYFAQHKSIHRLVDVRFVEEEEPTGTAGSLTLVPGLDETFFVMNGDVVTDLDFRALLRHHRACGSILTIATQDRHVKLDLGVVKLNDEEAVCDYFEKPEYTYPVSMGVYVYEPRVFEYMTPGRYLDFPDLVLRLLDAGQRVGAYRSTDLWLDVGNPRDYARAQELFAARREEFEFVS